MNECQQLLQHSKEPQLLQTHVVESQLLQKHVESLLHTWGICATY
jgi:hypothetical protein